MSEIQKSEISYSKEPITTDIETNWFESVDSFHKLGLKEELLRGIYGYGYEKPSPI